MVYSEEQLGEGLEHMYSDAKNRLFAMFISVTAFLLSLGVYEKAISSDNIEESKLWAAMVSLGIFSFFAFGTIAVQLIHFVSEYRKRDTR